MLQAFFREYTVGASMQKPSELPPLSAFNAGRVLPLQSKRVAHISYFVLFCFMFMCNSGGTVDFIHPDLFQGDFLF